MILEKLLKLSEQERVEAIHNLSDSDKTSLIGEIEKNKKDASDEKIRLETQKKSLEDQLNEQTEKMKSYGIANYEELDAEIGRLETELDAAILEYTKALSGE